MIHRKKILAFILCVCFILLTVCFGAFTIFYDHHECSGIYCEVCQILTFCENFSNFIIVSLLFALIHFILAHSRRNNFVVYHKHLIEPSLVILKVKLTC